MLEVKDVKLMYGDFTAVEDLSFTLNPGEILGLLGKNGVGKTTTFRTIMGLLKPTKGEVLYNNHIVSYADVNEIGYMIEERSLLTRTTVKDLVLYFGQLKEIETDEIIKRLDYWLNRFDIVEYKDKKIKELSKGNQQKIQFISAIINNPKLLILDEPFSGLDIINTESFVEVIRDFKSKGSMIVFSSHQIDHVESFCEKVVILEKGKAILSGNVKDIKREYQKQKISIIADKVDVKKLKGIKGVYDVIENADEIVVKIENESVKDSIFDYVKTLQNVTKFDCEAASLAEIFISKVGGAQK